MTMLADDTFGLPAIGDNNPPSPVEALVQNLAEANADLIARRDALVASAGTWPTTLEDEGIAARVTDAVRQLKAAIKSAESRRDEAKRPHLDAGRAVDAFFKHTIADPLDSAARTLTDRLTIYQRAKADAERRVREDAEARAREEAARLAASMTDADHASLDRAIAAEETARQAGSAAIAKPAELSRTRGDFGAVASLRTRWTFAVTDLAVVPREYLSLDTAKVNAAIKAGVREAPGLRIFQEQSTIVR